MTLHHHRRSIRLPSYDYSSAGAYFVTVCAKNRECLFGEIVDEEMRLNDAGRIVADTWFALSDHYSDLKMDAFVVMPNHVHGIIVVGAGLKPARTNPARTDCDAVVPVGAGLKPARTNPARTDCDAVVPVGAGLKPAPKNPAPTDHRKRHALPEILRGFKTFSARRINEFRHTPGIPVWQRNYYEHIIRNEDSLDRIRMYIAENPARWAYDRENAAATPSETREAWAV